MSETLFGGEMSGTPKETRGATRAAAKGVESYLTSGGTSGPLAKMDQQSMMALLGFDPSTIGFESALKSSLMDPTDVTAGLFRSMAPFEQQYLDRATTTQAGQFGGLGGRFSRNAMDANTLLRGQVGAEFARAREEALINAAAQRNQVLAALMQARTGAGSVLNQRLAAMYGFLNPGAPNFREGIFGDLLGAAGALGAAGIMAGSGGTAAAALPALGAL